MNVQTLREAAKLIQDRAETLVVIMYPGRYYALGGIQMCDEGIEIEIEDNHRYAEPGDNCYEHLHFEDILLSDEEFSQQITMRIEDRKKQEDIERQKVQEQARLFQEKQDRRELERLKEKLGE